MKTLAQSTRQNKFTPTTNTSNFLVQRKCACGGASKLAGQCSECEKKKLVGGNVPLIQPKLKIGQPNDKYEQEADRVADEVMRMPESRVQRQIGVEEEETIQTKPIASQITPLVQREIGDEEEELQAKELSNHSPVIAHQVQETISSLRGGGKPLSKSEREFYEPRLGVDFSKTRIHSEPLAAETASSLNARAFTLGRDIFFNSGELQPGTASGKRLLAHELVHTMQQRSVSNGPEIEMIQKVEESNNDGQSEDNELDSKFKGILKLWAKRVKQRGRVKKWIKRINDTKFLALMSLKVRRARRVLLLTQTDLALRKELGSIFLAELDLFLQTAAGQPAAEDDAEEKSESEELTTKEEETPIEELDKEMSGAPSNVIAQVAAAPAMCQIDGTTASPDSLEWEKHFKKRRTKPVVGGKNAVAATRAPLISSMVGGTLVFKTNFDSKKSEVWLPIVPGDTPFSDLKKMTKCGSLENKCKDKLRRANSKAQKANMILSGPITISWIEAVCEEEGREKDVIEAADCEMAARECVEELPLGEFDLLEHEKGHFWIGCLVADRANAKLAAGNSEKKVRKKAFAVWKKLGKLYDSTSETNHGCGDTVFWDKGEVQKRVDKEWPSED